MLCQKACIVGFWLFLVRVYKVKESKHVLSVAFL